MKKRTERVAELRAENPTEEEQKKEKKKTYDLEIFNGPFKGFHGNVVERLEDGVVRAEVVIFGKTNTVTLESSEYRETSKPPSKWKTREEKRERDDTFVHYIIH